MKQLLFGLVFVSVLLFPSVLSEKKQITPSLYGPYSLLIEDKDFYWFDCTLDQVKSFFRFYSKNKFTDEDIEFIYDEAKKNNISILVVSAKMEQESSIVTNCVGLKDYEKRKSRAMGYGLTITKKEDGKRVYVFGGFAVQVHYATKALSDFAKEFKGQPIRIHFDKVVVHCKNAPTYSLYKYCPFYGKFKNCGYDNIGNKLFVIIHAKHKKTWDKITNKNNELQKISP